LGFTWNTESACWRIDAMQLLERVQIPELSAITIDDILALEPGTSARLEISDGEVLVYNSYAIKDKLRALEFRFDSERRAWVRSVFEVKRLLELEDHADITLDKILAHSESMVQVTFAVQPVSVPSFCILLTRTCCIGGVGNLSSRQRGNLSSRQRGAVDSKKMGLS